MSNRTYVHTCRRRYAHVTLENMVRYLPRPEHHVCLLLFHRSFRVVCSASSTLKPLLRAKQGFARFAAAACRRFRLLLLLLLVVVVVAAAAVVVGLASLALVCLPDSHAFDVVLLELVDAATFSVRCQC